MRSGSPARRLAYYSLAQTAYAGLAGAFEMPMALRLAGRLELVAGVYAFYYTTLLAGFALGMLLVREGRASRVFRIQLSLQAALCLGAAAAFPRLSGLFPLLVYFSVRGVAEGLYWSARHRSFLWAVKDSGRDQFALRLQSFAVVVGVLAPLVSGSAVTFLGGFARAGNPVLPPGYASVFLATGSCLLLVLAFSPRLEIGRSGLSRARLAAIPREPRAATWRGYLLVVAVAGVAAGVGAGVLNFGILKTEFGVGALSGGIALVSGAYFAFLRSRLASGGAVDATAGGLDAAVARETASGEGGARDGRPAGARERGAFVGTSADFLSRFGYALLPLPPVLLAKSFLDAFAVPLRSLFGENLIRAEIEAISAASGASVAELYLYQEFRLWLARVGTCAGLGLLVLVATSAAGPGAERGAIRAAMALAAPLSLLEFRFLRRMARKA